MIDDFINLTQGQLLIKYWWLWIVIICVAVFSMIFNKKEM